MFFISENFRQQQKTAQPKKQKSKFVSSIPVQQPHSEAGLIITLISGMIAGTILLSNLKSPSYILLSVVFFIILNVAGRMLLHH